MANKVVRFVEKSKSDFEQMSPSDKDSNAIYFVYDNSNNVDTINQIYKGNELYSGGGGSNAPTLIAGQNITLETNIPNNTITINAIADGSGVGEWIDEGTEYVYEGVTYTVGKKVERFNLYGDEGNVCNQAAGDYSHVEGFSNKAFGTHSHAEGGGNVTIGAWSHVEGSGNVVKGEYGHAEGSGNVITSNYSHSEGLSNVVNGVYAHSEGYNNKSIGDGSHTEGGNNQATNLYCHVEGDGNTATNQYAHAEGYSNLVTARGGHIEGGSNELHSSDGHVEGNGNKLHQYSVQSHVEGYSNTVSGEQGYGSNQVHVEGYNNVVHRGNMSHAEGSSNRIIGCQQAHAEGYSNVITATSAHAEGSNNTVSGSSAHAQNSGNTASGASSSATGNNTTASGTDSTTMGNYTTASGTCSVAIGDHTTASGENQLVLGQSNISNNNTTSRTVEGHSYTINKFPFIIGNGSDFASVTSDAFKIDCEGKIYVRDTDGVDVSGLNVTSNDNNKVLTASYSGGVGTYSWQDALGGGGCVVHTYTDTALPAKVVLDNNNEYRYINLTNANSLTISIETIDITKSFYSTIVLHNVSSTDSLSTFVTVSGDSVISNIIFLNEDNVDLSISDTAELLFFTNGMSNTVMCIAYAYGTPTPPTPPTPSYDESKILVIELDANHDDTTNITEHATLLSAKNQLDTNYSTDSSKMYKLFIGDNTFNPPIGIEPNTSTFEDCFNLYNADIGESINNFYGGAFQGCHNLTIMTIPYAMTHMVGYNIQGTNLPSLTIHSNYLEMSGMVDYIFYNNNLTNLTFDSTGVVNLGVDEYGVDDSYNDLFAYSTYLDGSQNKPITITFGDNVTGIVSNSSGYLFGSNSGGVTINIPNSVTSISSNFLSGTDQLGGNIVVNIDNTNGAISGAPWGASGNNCTINYLR